MTACNMGRKKKVITVESCNILLDQRKYPKQLVAMLDLVIVVLHLLLKIFITEIT